MFSIFDRYIGRTILNTIFLTLLLLLGISGIIRFVDQLRGIQAGYTAIAAGYYTLLTIPKDIETFFPMAALLGGLIGLGSLAVKSELVVMEASGFTRFKITLAVMKTAIPLMILAMVIGEWVAPYGDQVARTMRTEKLYGHNVVSTQSGLWAKDGNDFIHINHVVNDNSIEDITLYQFNDQADLTAIIHATNGHYSSKDGDWILGHVAISKLVSEQKIKGEKLASMPWHSTLTPDKLSVVAIRPDSLSISGLYHYAQYLSSTGQDAQRYQLLFWNKMCQPISVAVMMLVAVSFIFGSLRNKGLGQRLTIGIGCGFLFYLLNQITGHISLIYNIPALLSAALPSLVFIAIGLIVLRKRN